MDFGATIELAKYTLALSGASFVYTLEKLTPAPTEGARWLALLLLAMFFVSTLCGIVIFSSATAALHGDEARARRQIPIIKHAARLHIAFLGLGILLLGARLVEKVLEAPSLPPIESSVSGSGLRKPA